MPRNTDKAPFRRVRAALCGIATASIGIGLPAATVAAPVAPEYTEIRIAVLETVPLPRPGRNTVQDRNIQSGSAGTPMPQPKPVGADTAAKTGSATPSPSTNATGALPTVSTGAPGSLRTVLAAIRAGQATRALAARNGLTDPIDRKIVDWHLARSGDPAVSSAFITQFAIAAPNWPSQKVLRRRAEQALARENPPASTVITAFKGLQPLSDDGTLLLANAYLAQGQKSKARALIRKFWRTEILSTSEESRVKRTFKALLDRSDHKARADMLLYRERANGALRLASYLTKDQRKLMDARIAVLRKTKKAAALLKAVPRSQRSDPGYWYAQIKYLRRTGKTKDAIQALLDAPAQKKDGAIGGDQWWVERRILSRDALDLDRPKDAYRIAAAHSAQSPAKRAEAEFHAGWYALRYLKDPARARPHFLAIERIGETPITRSRALYWLGRTAEAQNDRASAQTYYAQAAQYKTAFYGQLAQEKLGKKQLGLAPAPNPSAQDRANFARNELVIALHRLKAAGLDQFGFSFYRQLGLTLTKPGELALVTQMAEADGSHQMALMVGKLAIGRGIDADLLAFPTAAIPRKAKVAKDVGKPIVYAIARQESAFNPQAISSAGARGLLQLMPGTARATAKRAGMSYSKGRLTSDAAYNATLGAAHLGELLAEFNGSYILTFAAYNAGKRRSYEWMKRFGDPRGNRVDSVDWIERIPFSETRNYVQRIMENLVIYRARFERDTLQISKDLERG